MDVFEAIELLINQPILEENEIKIDIRQVLLSAFPHLRVSEEASKAVDALMLDFRTLEFAASAFPRLFEWLTCMLKPALPRPR